MRRTLLCCTLAALARPTRPARPPIPGDRPLESSRLSDPLALLAERVVDEHPRVRLDAVRALAAFPELRSAGTRDAALEKPLDRVPRLRPLANLPRASTRLVCPRSGRHTRHRRRSQAHLRAPGRRLAEVVPPLLDAVEAGRVADDRLAAIYALVGSLGSPEHLARALKKEPEPSSSETNLRTRLDALASASAPRGVSPADTTSLALVFDRKESSTQASAARAAGLWKVEGLRDSLRQKAEAVDEPEAVRLCRYGSPRSPGW